MTDCIPDRASIVTGALRPTSTDLGSLDLSSFASPADVVAAVIGRHEGFLEIRCLPSRTQRFFDLSNPRAIEQAVAFGQSVADEDVYFGIAPRVRERGTNEDVTRVGTLFADCDSDAALDALARFPIPSSAVIESGGLTEREQPKCHCYWLLAESADPDAARAANKRLATLLGSDRHVHDPARVARLPGTRHYKNESGRPVRVIGFHPDRRYSLEHILASLPEIRPGAAPAMNGAESRDHHRVSKGLRHSHLRTLGGRLAAAGASREAIEAAIIAEDHAICDPPQGTEAEEQARDFARRWADAGRRFPLTDLGNAERLVELHGDDICFTPGQGWRAYDDQRWRQDDTGEVERRACHSARAQYLALVEQTEDDAARAERVSWAKRSESARSIRAAVSLAERFHQVVVTADQLDVDPWVLNVENGTVDLRTGQLREHCREDLITCLAAAEFRPDARSEIWDNFLRDATRGDAELAQFLQLAVGYTLTGLASEDIVIFLHGPGATGKSSFAEAIKAMLGDYAANANFGSFLRKRGDGGVPTDIARLNGKRMVVASEVDDEQRLAEGVLKSLTGGDTVTARFLYQNHFEFRPQFTLWLVANERPRAKGDDDALWRRLVQVPFHNTIPEHRRDPQIRSRLTKDPGARAAVLAWAVEGCLLWQKHGLAVPDTVRAYTSEYRLENDPVGRWLSERCYFDEQAVTSNNALRQDHSRWAEANSQAEVQFEQIIKGLRNQGCKPAGKVKGDRAWRGVGLNAAATLGADTPPLRVVREVSA